MAVAALVLGILSIIFALIPGFVLLGILFSIVGIVLGVLGKRDPATAKMANAGMICSIVGLILSALFYIACIACAAGLSALSGY